MKTLLFFIAFTFFSTIASATLVFAPGFTPPGGALSAGTYTFKLADLISAFPSPTYGAFDPMVATFGVTTTNGTLSDVTPVLTSSNFQLEITLTYTPASTGAVSFTFTTNKAGAPTFIWASSALPIELTRFEVKALNGIVGLNWETASETNNDFYSIERSFDGLRFTEVADVNGSGTTTTKQRYAFEDVNAAKVATANMAYYRLKQTDFDGNFAYSHIVTVDLRRGTFQINPINAANDYVTFETSREVAEDIEVQVIDMSGRIMESKNVTISEGFNQVSLDLSQLSTGIYTVVVGKGNLSTTKKFMKS
jgi:Secretion system C-terminal sorting domain